MAPVPTSARSPARADVEVGGVGGPPRAMLAAGAVALALVGTALVTLGLSAAILVCLLVGVLGLCVWAPPYAFALSLALYSFEGTVKMRLSVDDAPSPVAIGAAALDFAFLASLVALLLSDRGRSPFALWERATRVERVAAVLLGLWLGLSVVQIPVGGDLTNGLEGFRLTQFYAVALLGGIVLAARLGPERLAPVLLALIALAVVYAGVRGITGPTRNEQLFAEERARNASFGDFGRNTGSFTGPVGLVSFLVPAALLCLAFGFLRKQRRMVPAVLFGLGMTGIVASFVRTALVAVVAGVALMAVLLLVQKGAGRGQGRVALAIVVLVFGGGYTAALIAGEVTPETSWRAHSLAKPFADYSVTTRLDIWGRTLDKVADEPLGTGVGTLGRATLDGRRAKFTDNSYLKILQEQGVPGALLFLGGLGGLFVAAAIGLARIGPSRQPLGTAALVAVSGFLVLMVMGEYIEQPGKLLAWTLLGVALWAARD